MLFLTVLEHFGQPMINGRLGAIAIECIHTYSLIHDDLPSMDDDDMRRGQPANHIKFGEAQAILAGDALLTLAFQLLSNEPGDVSGKMSAALSKAAGANGMVAGQLLDIENQGQNGDLEDLVGIHERKTGALIACSVEMAGIRSHQSKDVIELLKHFGLKLGLIFQVKDDILDVTSHHTTFGKTVGKDASQGKLTFPSLLGLEGSERYLKNLVDEGRQDLERLGLNNGELEQILTFLEKRKQ